MKVNGYGCDISNEESVQKTMNSINQDLGGLHVVCNSAGIVENFPAVDYVSKLKERERAERGGGSCLSLEEGVEDES